MSLDDVGGMIDFESCSCVNCLLLLFFVFHFADHPVERKRSEKHVSAEPPRHEGLIDDVAPTNRQSDEQILEALVERKAPSGTHGLHGLFLFPLQKSYMVMSILIHGARTLLVAAVCSWIETMT